MRSLIFNYLNLKPLAVFIFALGVFSPTSHAAVIFHIWEDGSDLRFQASGSFDVGNEIGDTELFGLPNFALVDDTNTVALIGDSTTTFAFNFLSDPLPVVGVGVGLGQVAELNSVTGPSFGFSKDNAVFGPNALILGSDIIDGSFFTTTGFISSASLASAGIQVGTFVWNLPNDSVTIFAGLAPPTSVSAPSSLALFTFAIIAVTRRRRKNSSSLLIKQ